MSKLVYWFIQHRTAANLLLLGIVCLGLIAANGNRKELMPNLSLNRIAIAVAYPGASPTVVEKSLCRRIEQAIIDLPGLESVAPVSHEGLCDITAFAAPNANTDKLLIQIKSRIDAIRDLPRDAAKPFIRELMARNRVTRLVLSGKAPYQILLAFAENFRKALLQFDAISVVDTMHVAQSEISINVSALDLQRYNISFSELAAAIRNNATDTPGGRVKASDNDILLSSQAKAENAEEFAALVLRASNTGSRLTLEDIATIREGTELDNGFASMPGIAESTVSGLARFNGDPAIALDIYREGDESIVDIAKNVRQLVANTPLPQKIQIQIWEDNARHFSERIHLLLKNGLSGLALLFTILLLFLNRPLAVWVSVGIPVAFLGAFAVLPGLAQSINIISLFALVLVMGIVVDDALVVGESIYTYHRRGFAPQRAALYGTLSVLKPVFFSVATSIIFFIPLLFLPGVEGNLILAIPVMVIATLIFSLIESFLILPAHLAAGLNTYRATSHSLISAWQQRFSQGLNWLIFKAYQPVLHQVLRRKTLVIACFSSLFVFSMVLVVKGWIPLSLFTSIDAEVASANIAFAEGSPARKTAQALLQIERAAQALAEELESEFQQQVITDIYSIIGAKKNFGNAKSNSTQQHTGQVLVSLSSERNPTLTGEDIARRWREKSGDIPGALNLQYSANLFPSKPDIHIELATEKQADLLPAVRELKSQLAEFQDVFEIRDTLSGGKPQLALQLKPVAYGLGLSVNELGTQVHQAFHGIEVQRLQRGEQQISVWLRYPEQERASLWYLENMPIRLKDGSSVPLFTVADIEYQDTVTSLRKKNRLFVAEVSAFVQNKHRAATILQQLETDYLSKLATSDISWSPGRSLQRTQLLLQKLKAGYLIALIAIYILLAILFASYSQPLLIMLAIPFGLLGSLLGHGLLNYSLTLWSLVGMIAASGVVVNDNLVLVNSINQLRKRGTSARKAVYQACLRRFRPVALTSLTTFVGLIPLLFERSIQAQFLIPTAISLAFGVLFATLVCLLLVPASYLLLLELRLALQVNPLAKPEAKESAKLKQSFKKGLNKG